MVVWLMDNARLSVVEVMLRPWPKGYRHFSEKLPEMDEPFSSALKFIGLAFCAPAVFLSFLSDRTSMMEVMIERANLVVVKLL